MLKLNFKLCDELISTEAESKTGKELSLSNLQWGKVGCYYVSAETLNLMCVHLYKNGNKKNAVSL